MTNYPLSYLIINTSDTILHIQQPIIISKSHIEFQPDWF